MDLSTHFLVFITLILAQWKVVAAASSVEMAAAGTSVFIFMVFVIWVLRFYFCNAKRSNRKVEDEQSEVNVVVVTKQDPRPPYPAGHQQPYHDPYQRPPAGNSMPPPPPATIYNDPAYPPAMPMGNYGGQAAGQQPSTSNPFRNAAYGQ